MDYDVFISCKSEDYKYAESIYNFLKDNGINAFLASTELRRLGISEYRRAVVQAMKTAYHLIVFASKPEYVDSRWVYYEWDMFINAKLKGRKQGQILTILKDIDVDDINMDLWKYESFAFSNYRDTLLNYVETPSSMRRKELAKRREEEAAEQIRIQVEQKRNQLKKDIQNKESEYFHICENLNLLSREIVDLWKEIGVTKKSCPICGEETFIDSNYCRNCGWTFIPMFPTKNISSEEHLQISRRNWKLISQLSYISNLEDMDDIYERFQKAMSESSLLKQENERLLQENKYIENKSRINDSLEAENAWQDSCKSEKGILRKAGSFILNGMMRGDGIILDQKEKQTPNLNRWNLVDAVIESCPTRRGSIFGRDKLQKVGFDENRFREIMKTKYGITLNSKELSVCITIDDLKKYVAQLTGTKLF